MERRDDHTFTIEAPEQGIIRSALLDRIATLYEVGDKTGKNLTAEIAAVEAVLAAMGDA